MVISRLIDSLNYIKEIHGDLNVQILYDIKQSGLKDINGICIDEIRSLKIKDNNDGVYLSNEFSYSEEFLGYQCTVSYYPDERLYRGFFYTTKGPIEGYDTGFVARDEYGISNAFHEAVNKYMEFANARNIVNTYKAVNKILNTYDDTDSDYNE